MLKQLNVDRNNFKAAYDELLKFEEDALSSTVPSDSWWHTL